MKQAFVDGPLGKVACQDKHFEPLKIFSPWGGLALRADQSNSQPTQANLELHQSDDF